MSPQLDVTDLLFDPDFADDSLTYTRLSQTVGANGLAVNTPITLPFIGVVTSAGGRELDRTPVGERVRQFISVITQTRLTDGRKGFSADVVTWQGNQFTVVKTDNYSTYGRGFIEAVCELLPMSG